MNSFYTRNNHLRGSILPIMHIQHSTKLGGKPEDVGGRRDLFCPAAYPCTYTPNSWWWGHINSYNARYCGTYTHRLEI